MRVLWLILVLVCEISAVLNNWYYEVEYQCQQHCALQNRTDAAHYDYACDFGCNVKQCKNGCELWRQALHSSCQHVCNVSLDRFTKKEIDCLGGCNDAMAKYFAQLKSKFIAPPAPALVADSLNSTSLKLEWNFPEAREVLGLYRHVQWKYEEWAASWHYSRNATWSADNTVVLIEELQPYTKYRFRIALMLSQDYQDKVILSNPSVVISTIPSGIPVSPPSNDISADRTYDMLKLNPDSNYTIAITMRNSIGSGPAATVTVSTPPEPLAKDTQQPVLFLGTEHSVIEQGTSMGDEPQILYNTSNTIKGIGIHIRKQLIFVSDSGGHIWKMLVSKNYTSNTTDILAPIQMNFTPLELSVDWLNDQLYILGEVKSQQQRIWQIARCDLYGRGLTVAVAGLTMLPYNIEVDPYNGYLFWATHEHGGGIYRLDISDISNGIKHEIRPVLILQDPNSGAFTVDHTNFRLFVANENQETINSVSLDGKEITNMRPHVITSKLRKVVSLTTANKKFYWTDGDDLFVEERYKSDYFHNSYPGLSARSYKQVIINLPSSQPLPSPVNPPINVQAIFGSSVAKVSWQAPHLLGIQGKGAWQSWSYEVAIKDVDADTFSYHQTVNLTNCKIGNLKENTKYVIKVAAYTTSGKGPWSSEFKGMTLSKSENPVIYWSGAKGLLTSDSTGDNVTTLIHKSRINDFHFIDMTWYQHYIYLITNDSHVYWYNTKTHQQGQLNEVDSAGSIAVDWIGKKLYWSNPKRQMIIRGNFNGTHQEPLPIPTLAKELNIDSVKAYIYWSTGFAVKCAHLNGEDAIEYHPVQLFSGKQVMGLTLDLTAKDVYWIVRGSEGSNLFRAPMAGYGVKITGEKISSLQKPNMQGPLCYFHKRLLWLQDDKNAVISDLQGKNFATISGKSMSDLTLVYVVDSSLVSEMGDNIVVTPQPVDNQTIRVIGSLHSFNVTWEPVNNVNYGEVMYEVSIDNLERNDSTVTIRENSVKYWQKVGPFTELNIAIRAFTYWATSSQIRAKIKSPASTPSAPRNLRAFVNDVVTLRWNLPFYPNGVIQGYKIHYWYDSEDLYEVIQTSDYQIEITISNQTQLFFNVQAYNEVGDGDLSENVSIDLSRKSPIPILLVAKNDSISIHDMDSHRNLLLLNSVNTPISITYSFKESKLYWINQLHLMMFDIINNSHSEIIDLKKSSSSLTIDWIERSLYFIQEDSCISKLDLNVLNKKTILCSDRIKKLEVSPFTRKLYWIENFKLMSSNSDGTEKTEFVSTKKTCNCPTIVQTYCMTHSLEEKPAILIVDNVGTVFSSDKYGCECSQIPYSAQSDKISCDLVSLYEYSGTSVTSLNENVTRLNNVVDFAIFADYVQPFPPLECVQPRQKNYEATIHNKSSTSLTLQMPTVVPACDNSMPIVQYQIHYKPGNSVVTTFDDKYTLENLKPFTKYSIRVSVSNFYTPEGDIILGEAKVFQTAVGAPSKPQNISATVLNPTMAQVSWLPPEEFNGRTVHYEIYWKTGHTLSGVRQEEKPNVEDISPNSTLLTAILNKLSPNKTYTVYVRAYSETNKTYSDSESVQIHTYPDPTDLVLMNASANCLVVMWESHPQVENFTVQYSPVASSLWENITDSDEEPLMAAKNLKPKTLYKFRLLLFFPEEYIWPADSRFTFETLGDKPTPPGIPEIQYVKSNIYKVWWEASRDNGASVILYKLEGLELPNYRTKRATNRTAFSYTAPSIEEEEREWQQLYNGTETSWIVDGLSEKFKYEFRSLALNEYGWSEPSESSASFDLKEAARMAENQNPLALIVVAICIPLIVIGGILICLVCRKFGSPKKVQVVSIPRGPDVELATLRELPRRGIHSTNVLYVSTQPTSEELTLLPHIRRDQITLMKFLGSGAFGEVFEGKARAILSGSPETKVAVKTLRKGATDQEKTEFLQEAQLMSNFKHEHILQLLGVCLDNDPHFIIMELMQGGDLLTYLRSSRNPNMDTPSLTLIELLKMCVDVAKGCRYLEEMHFVHRDLACRNCLVSSRDSDRIVKIGDFGLARDIYKNDYYRKEGEGLLPVRWMAPESLVDGVFTSQSDVWAFGVLLWEIMTLGQQPYPARNNLEVLHYVRCGGRLGKPTDCPETSHNLMLKCWEFDCEKRPTFKYCLDILENLHFQKLRSPTTGAHEGQYISTVQECNLEDDKEKTPFLAPETPTSIPKYLELLYEPETSEINDGYEIPNQMLAEVKNSSSLINGNVPKSL